MITTLDQIVIALPSEFYRGIFSLQTILRLRNNVHNFSNTRGSNIPYYPINDLSDLMRVEAIRQFTRLSSLHRISEAYFYGLAQWGQDGEIERYINAQIAPNWLWGLAGVVASGNIDQVARFLDRVRLCGNISLDRTDACVTAAKYGHLEILKFLLRTEQEIGFELILDSAAMAGQTEVVDFLLTEIRFDRDRLAHALLLAVCNNHHDLVILLLKSGSGVDVNSLTIAIDSGYRDIVRAILDCAERTGQRFRWFGFDGPNSYQGRLERAARDQRECFALLIDYVERTDNYIDGYYQALEIYRSISIE